MPTKKINEADFDQVFSGEDAIERGPEPEDEGPVTNRGLAATNLWIGGASYDQIATRFGYSSPARARAAVEKVLAGAYEPSDYAAARNGARARLSKMLQIATRHALQETVERYEIVDDREKKFIEPNSEQFKWFQGWLAVQDRMIRLDGLDAPTRVELRTPEVAEMEALVSGLLRAGGVQRQLEGDPFGDDDEIEGEVVEDDDDGE